MSQYFHNTYDENNDFYDTYEDYSYKDVTNYDAARWKELCMNCIVPSFFQILYYVLPIIVVNMFLCFINKIQVRYFPSHHSITHAFSGACGLLLMQKTLEHGHAYLLQLLVPVYILVKVSVIEQKWLRLDFLANIYAILYLII